MRESIVRILERAAAEAVHSFKDPLSPEEQEHVTALFGLCLKSAVDYKARKGTLSPEEKGWIPCTGVASFADGTYGTSEGFLNPETGEVRMPLIPDQKDKEQVLTKIKVDVSGHHLSLTLCPACSRYCLIRKMPTSEMPGYIGSKCPGCGHEQK